MMNSLVFVFGLFLLVSINGLTPAPTASILPTPSPTNGNGVPSEKPTASPTVGGSNGVSPSGLPSPSPTPSPVSPGTVPTARPTKLPTPSPGTSPAGVFTPSPTNVNGVPSEKPTASPVSPGTVPTPHPTSDGSVLTPLPTSRPTNIGEMIPTPIPSPGPTPSPGTVPTSSNGASPTSLLSSSPTVGPTKSPINGALARCIATDESLDVIFMVDSSGSVYDEQYKNWQNELDLVYDIIDNALPVNSRVGLINFSGCSSSFSMEECKEYGRLKKMIGLRDNGSPNDLDAVLSTVDAIGADDFNGGYTWTREALEMALEEFLLTMGGVPESNKMVILISDGSPYPYAENHELCRTSDNYVSQTLQSMRDLGVEIISVGIDLNAYDKMEYFDCISDGSDDFYFDATFDSIPSLAPTQNGLDVPSNLPTKSPISGTGQTNANSASSNGVSTPPPTNANGVPSEQPTPSATAGAGSSPHPTSDGSALTPVPTPVSPGTVPTARPTITPTPSPVSPGTVPTPHPTSDGSVLTPLPTSRPTNIGEMVPTPIPSPGPTPSPGTPPSSSISVSPTVTPTATPGTVPTSSVVAIEDLSDSIGDFICAELGSTRLIVPTVAPSSMPTSIIEPSPKPTTDPTLGNLKGECSSSSTVSTFSELDIIFMVDSSGSVYDDEYNNWQAELDLVNDIIQSLPSDTSRVSLINFAGCGESFTLEECQDLGRLETVFGLTSYGSPNDLDLVSDKIESMSSDDFLGGYTWTNEALGLALDQFTQHSIATSNKIIVLLTDGEPYPYNQGHEPCITSSEYESDILILLNELDVDIITIAVDIALWTAGETLECISPSYFGVSQFKTLESLSVEIGELICDKIDGSFSTMSFAPSMKPTSMILTPTLEPTPSPVRGSTMEPTFDGEHPSHGVMPNIFVNLAVISGLIGYLLTQ